MAVGRQAHSLKLTGDHNQISDEKQYHDQIFVRIVGKKSKTRIRYLYKLSLPPELAINIIVNC